MSRYFLISCALLSGCVVGPRYSQPATDVPAKFASKAEGTVSAEVEAEWWRLLHDSQLNGLIRDAEVRNLDLKVAEARLKEARALFRQARFDLYPTVTSEAGYTNTRESKARSISGRAASSELHDLALDASYELDFFGRVRRSIQAARATEEAVDAQRDALLIDLRSEVAINYLLVR
ncbi:MAG: hypothetical protein JWO08_3632, partial [Verrucomicrobiaceae bacterium]|nr:hypothetical protein [Verrucomicrobiaceae bacterium]